RYIAEWKRQIGGSYLRIVRNPATGRWDVDRSADAVRYDATSQTAVLLTGLDDVTPDQDDVTGELLPSQVVSGIMGDCSGGVTPRGTVVTVEENLQGYYGDLEFAWTSHNKFVAGSGFDPGSAVRFETTPSTASDFGASSLPSTRHARDLYGYLV